MPKLTVLTSGAVLIGCLCAPAAQAQETVRSMLAAQIRTQGYVCDKTLKAVKDKKRSRADHDVWVLACSNATYRISRTPDLAAKVDVVR